jgi:uridine phosphorylase
MGHAAASLNCILANRVTGEFSRDPQGAIDDLILYALEKLTSQA